MDSGQEPVIFGIGPLPSIFIFFGERLDVANTPGTVAYMPF